MSLTSRCGGSSRPFDTLRSSVLEPTPTPRRFKTFFARLAIALAVALLLWAHTLQGLTLSMRGESTAALRHLQEGVALYDPNLHGPDRTQVGAQDPKVTCLSYAAWTLWRQRRRVGHLYTWVEQLAARRGRRIAVIALARRVSRILYAIWRDQTVFRCEAAVA